MKNLTIYSAILILYVLLMPFSSNAQGNIEGIIIDEVSKEPIPFTNVALEKNGDIIASTTTNYDGMFYFDNVLNGNYSILVQSYESKKRFNDIVIFNESVSYNFSFNPAIVLDGGTAKGHKGLITPEKMDRYDHEFIENVGAINIKEIETLAASVVETDQGISYKGARPGTAVYYIDGIRTYGDLYIPMSSVGSLEIYNGGIPAQFGNTTSAVIVVETKSYFDKY